MWATRKNSSSGVRSSAGTGPAHNKLFVSFLNMMGINETTFGMTGAAWATVLSYAVMAGMGFAISRRLFPIPFEGRRWLAAAAVAAGLYGVSTLAPASFAVRAAFEVAIVAAYPLILVATGLLKREI